MSIRHFLDISDQITIMLDLKVIIDDVPFGLSLQRYTPFRFSCNRLWVKHIPDVQLPPTYLYTILGCEVGFYCVPN